MKVKLVASVQSYTFSSKLSSIKGVVTNYYYPIPVHPYSRKASTPTSVLRIVFSDVIDRIDVPDIPHRLFHGHER